MSSVVALHNYCVSVEVTHTYRILCSRTQSTLLGYSLFKQWLYLSAPTVTLPNPSNVNMNHTYDSTSQLTKGKLTLRK